MEKKYRIYDKLNKEYCEEPDHRWMLSRNGKLYNSENDEWHEVGERFIVEFFTGLHDKNGKEIYEGDIVKDHYCEYSDDSFTVKFYNGAFYPMVQVKEGYNCILKYDKEQFEIIGNIYETTPTNNI